MAIVRELASMIDRPQISRRTALVSALRTGASAAALPMIGALAGCAAAEQSLPGVTKVYVLGTIHANHRDSDRYSLAVLERAVRQAAPDVILAEIPPDRIEQAIRSFRETGIVDEPRTQVFPEYTEVIFPLGRELNFQILGTAGWTQQIADERRAALERIQSDPARANQWAEHCRAQREYRARLTGRGDDPRFIHTKEFDQLVELSRNPYQRYFDRDLGPGGWSQINKAHTDLINEALDSITGKGLAALVTFGTAHKYMIDRALAQRRDIELQDSAALFM